MRILLAGMSNMLVNVITAVCAQTADLVVAGQVGEGDDLHSIIRSTRADVVIVRSASPDDTDAFVPWLHSFPVLKVVAITMNGRSGFLHELQPISTPIPELSAEVLKTTLRGGLAPKPH